MGASLDLVRFLQHQLRSATQITLLKQPRTTIDVSRRRRAIDFTFRGLSVNAGLVFAGAMTFNRYV